MPSNSYYFHDHVRYLAAFMEDVVLKEKTEKLFLVVHDWGSALGFDWASKNPSRIAGLVFMEFICPGLSLKDFAEGPRTIFTDIRTEEKGRKLIMEQNIFVEVLLGQAGTARGLSDAEMRHYREPFLKPTNREPVYRFPNELPFDGHPSGVVEIVKDYWDWMQRNEVPKLMFWGEPGAIISVEKAREIETGLKNVRSIGIGAGSHYLQEDNPHLIGAETRKFVQEVLNMA
jgi:haloalkane dehalogenase